MSLELSLGCGALCAWDGAQAAVPREDLCCACCRQRAVIHGTSVTEDNKDLRQEIIGLESEAILARKCAVILSLEPVCSSAAASAGSQADGHIPA